MPDRDISQQVEERLAELYERHPPVEDGIVCQYYDPGREYYGPELAGAERDSFAIAVADLDGETHCVGSSDQAFAMQSISKAFVYGLALEDHGRDYVLEPRRRRADGRRVQLDRPRPAPQPAAQPDGQRRRDRRRPRWSRARTPRQKLERIVEIVRRLRGQRRARRRLARRSSSRRRHRHRNRAIGLPHAQLQGMLERRRRGDARPVLPAVLDAVTCRDLAVMAATLANGGVNPVTGARALARARSATC